MKTAQHFNHLLSIHLKTLTEDSKKRPFRIAFKYTKLLDLTIDLHIADEKNSYIQIKLLSI